MYIHTKREKAKNTFLSIWWLRT